MKLRWTKTYPDNDFPRIPLYCADCRFGELIIVMDHDGWILMSFPPDSDRRQPKWERGPFATVKRAKTAAQRQEDMTSAGSG
jgi:hypothetical protein